MLRKKCIEPINESWSEWRFLTELAKRLGLEENFPWKNGVFNYSADNHNGLSPGCYVPVVISDGKWTIYVSP